MVPGRVLEVKRPEPRVFWLIERSMNDLTFAIDVSRYAADKKLIPVWEVGGVSTLYSLPARITLDRELRTAVEEEITNGH